jgi:hypothetical protein
MVMGLNDTETQDGVCPFKSYDASTKPRWNAAGRQALVGPAYSATLGKDVLTELDGSPALLPLRRSIAEKASNPAGKAPQARDARSTQVCILLRADRVSVATRQLVHVQLYRRQLKVQLGRPPARSHTSWSMPAVSLRIATETRPIRNSTEATDHVMHLQLQIRLWIRRRISLATAAQLRPARPAEMLSSE